MKPNHDEAIKVIREKMVAAIDTVKRRMNADGKCLSGNTVEQKFKHILGMCEYRYHDTLAACGFTFLGSGARRIGFSYTHNGVRYIVKGDKESNEFMLEDDPCPTGNIADWVANETLVKMYPVLKPLVAIIYGGFDIDECLFLVQEPITVADACEDVKSSNALHSPSNCERKRVLAAIVNDVAGNGQNYGIDSDGNLKVSDLDRFQYRRAAGISARLAADAYERWEKQQLQPQ